MFELKIEGVEELNGAVKKIGAKIRQNFAQEAMITALTPMVNAAKQMAERSKDTGALINSIGFRVKPYKKNGGVFAVVGPRRGFKGPDMRDPTKYAHLVEFGHIPKGKSNVVAIQPFMRPAWQLTKNGMIPAMANVLGQNIRAEIARKAQKRKRKKS